MGEKFVMRCETCRHWQRDSGGDEGGCFWGMPPILLKLVDMLKSEPATHIDYKEALFGDGSGGAPGTHANYGCGAWAGK